jgi:translation initiation factor IF-3
MMMNRVLQVVNNGNGKNSAFQQKEVAYVANDKIKAPRVQLITNTGQNVGIVTKEQAQQMAFEAHLDLVLISEQGQDGIPIAKIMDLGKSLYERKKKQKDAKKNQKIIQIKEIKLRPKIGEHDYLTKLKQMIQFLKEGKRVKITLSFRGRENASKEERGGELFQKILHTLQKEGFSDNLVQEKDDVSPKLWSRMYYLKNIK